MDVGSPVHPLRLSRKVIEHVWAPSQSRSYLPCLLQASVAQGFLLAGIGQSVALPACENGAAAQVQLRHGPIAILAVRAGDAVRPCTSAAKVTRRPGNRHALLDRLPLAIFSGPRIEHQDHGFCFGAHSDAAGWLSGPGPRIRKALAGMEAPLPMPAARVNRRATLIGVVFGSRLSSASNTGDAKSRAFRRAGVSSVRYPAGSRRLHCRCSASDLMRSSALRPDRPGGNLALNTVCDDAVVRWRGVIRLARPSSGRLPASRNRGR
jgi:hypothetical protein